MPQKNAATVSAPPIQNVLVEVVKQVTEARAIQLNEAQYYNRPAPPPAAVDIEITFRNVVMSEQGLAIFGKDREESQIEIRLATRVLPPE